MKNTSLILNGVLLVAVLVLYILHFNGPTVEPAVASQNPTSVQAGENEKSTSAREKEMTDEAHEGIDTSAIASGLVHTNLGASSFPVAFIDVNELNDKSVFVQQQNKILKNKQAKIEKRMKTKLEKFQQDALTFENQAKTGFITSEAEYKKKLQELQEKELAIQQEHQDEMTSLSDDQYRIQNKLKEDITKYLEDNAARYKYELVVGYQDGLLMLLYQNKQFELTQETIKALNKMHKK